MNRQQRRHPDQRMPPVIAFLDAAELMGSGSPLYRIHRPAGVLAEKLDWITLVSSRHAPPEDGHPWLVEVEGEAMCPNALVLRPTMLTTLKAYASEYEDITANWEAMRRHVEDAQKQGQIVLLDLDDHPYAWNALHPDERDRFDEATWQVHDDYIRQFNAVLCSTNYLVGVMERRFNGNRNRQPTQRFEYAPNLYDPWRYHPETAAFGKHLGSHLYVKARDRADFSRLGELAPLFEADPDLRFLHIGEEYLCTCQHREDEHFEQGPCDHCACEEYTDAGHHSLADASGLPADRIDTLPTCTPFDLPDRLTYNVGVVPLADSDWNYAKTESKGFEMAAAGIPFVALTGEHPLYKKMFPNPHLTGLGALFDDEPIWKYESQKARQWAEAIAKEHQIEYLATLKRLSGQNLAK